MEAEKKLRRARTMLILGDGDEPFFGSIAIGLNLVPTVNCPTAATDGKRLWYNPDWIVKLDAEQAMALFEHEVLHIAFKHGSLMLELIDDVDFDHSIWQQACDIPINFLLVRKGRKVLDIPGGAMYDPRFDGMGTVRVYRILNEEKKQRIAKLKSQMLSLKEQLTEEKLEEIKNGILKPEDKLPQDVVEKIKVMLPEYEEECQQELLGETGDFGGIVPLLDDDGNIAPKEKIKELENDFEMTVMNSARVLQKHLGADAGDIPGFVQEIIKSHTEPQRTYKDDILDIMEEITRNDYNWGRPNKKYNIYMPSLYELVLAELVVIVDSSGSVSQNELEVYASEITGILDEFQGLEIHVIFHHTRAYHIETYTSDDFPITFGKIISGGTCYRHAYERIKEEGYEPKVILHFTDLAVGKSNYPDKEPDFPVFWMNTTPRKSDGSLRYSKPPWGTVIDLDPYV